MQTASRLQDGAGMDLTRDSHQGSQQRTDEARRATDAEALPSLDDEGGEFSSQPMPAAFGAILFLVIGLGVIAFVVVAMLW